MIRISIVLLLVAGVAGCTAQDWGVQPVLATGASAQTPVGKVFQAHTPDGARYLVVTCYVADECLEYA
jgi:hypothetical protein